MNVFDFLKQLEDPTQREALAGQLATLYGSPAEMASMTPQAQGNLPPAAPEAPPAAAPQMPAPMPTAATPPIAPVQPQVQGPFTSPPGSDPTPQPGMAGTQSGPAVENPEVEKAKKEQALAALLAGGDMGLMQAPASNAPQAPGGSGPSLGSAAPAQGFTATTPTPDAQAMLSLARLLGGQ